MINAVPPPPTYQERQIPNEYKSYIPEIRIQLENTIEKDTVDYKIVIIGDFNISGKNYFADMIQGQNNIAVFHQDYNGVTTTDSLKNNTALNKAIINSTHIIIIPFDDYNLSQEEIFQTIYDIKKPSTQIISMDMPISTDKYYANLRNTANNQNTNFQTLNITDRHIETNQIGIDIKYKFGGKNLDETTEEEIAKYVIEEIFNNIPSDNLNIEPCYTYENISEFIYTPIQNIPELFDLNFTFFGFKNNNDVQTDNPDYIYQNNEFIPINGHNQNTISKVVDGEIINYGKSKAFINNEWKTLYIIERDTMPEYVYYMRYDQNIQKAPIIFPKIKNPIDNIEIHQSLTDYKSTFLDKIKGHNMPTDTLSNQTEVYAKWIKYINTLPIDEQFRFTSFAELMMKGVYYKENVFAYNKTPNFMEEYTDTLTNIYYTIDTLGNTNQHIKQRLIQMSSFDNIEVIFNKVYVAIEMAKMFPDKYDAMTLLMTMYAVSSVETGNNAGIQTDSRVISKKGNSSLDYGQYQFNYKTMKWLRDNNPEFWDQFFYFDDNKKEIIFYSWIAEDYCFAYFLQLVKMDDAIPKNGDFYDMAYAIASFHSKTPAERKKYAEILAINLKQAYEFFSDEYSSISENIVDEVIREYISKNYQNQYIPTSEFVQIDRVVIDNKDILDQDYPNKLKNKIQSEPISFKLSLMNDVPIIINQSKINIPQNSDALDNNSQIYVYDDGYMAFILKEGQYPYEVGRNLLRQTISYHNNVVDKRKKDENKLLLCAEKNGELILLNEKIPFDELPQSVQIILKNEYTDDEINQIYNSDILYDYEVIWWAFKQANFKIYVRVGNPMVIYTELDELNDELKNNQITESKYKQEINELKDSCPYMTDEKTPQIFIKPSNFILDRSTSKFQMLGIYFDLINEKNIIDDEFKEKTELLKIILEKLKLQNTTGYITTPINENTIQINFFQLNDRIIDNTTKNTFVATHQQKLQNNYYKHHKYQV